MYFNRIALPALIVFSAIICAFSSDRTAPFRAGFFLPDSVDEVSFRYKRVNNLILLPVTINDSIRVNLILDTGCRNVVLFGRRFMKQFDLHPDKKVEFSGLGSGKPVAGRIALENKVSIDAVLGERIPVVVVPNPNLFGAYAGVDGVIGYDVFIKFEVALLPRQRQITFRPALQATLPEEYNLIPIRVEDSRPIATASVSLFGKKEDLDVMIDTGSSLGLLLKNDTGDRVTHPGRAMILGRGLNGPVEGINIRADHLVLHDFAIGRIIAGVVHTHWSGISSIGMDLLDNYSIVLNYCKGYMGLKRDQMPLADALQRSKSLAAANF